MKLIYLVRIAKVIILIIVFTLLLYKVLLYFNVLNYNNNVNNVNNTNNSNNVNKYNTVSSNNITLDKINHKLSYINNKRNIYYCGIYKLNTPLTNAISSYKLDIVSDISRNIKLYIPCGFNYLEVELNKIRFASDNSKYNLRNIVILGIAECDKLCSKNDLWDIISKQYGIEKAKTIIPRSYILNKVQDMNELNYMSKDNLFNTIFILKNNKQGKKGLYLTNNIADILINDNKVKQYKLAQEYMINPYLINNRKINIRLYILVINRLNNIPEWYLYNKGKCIYTNKNFTSESLNDINILDKEQHFTSLNLNTDYVYNVLKNPESMDDLQKHLGDVEYNILMDKIYSKLEYIRTAYNNQKILNNKDNLVNNICIQYFGIDIILDSELEPYILEFNKGPEMKYKTKNDISLKDDLLLDIIGISIMEYDMINPRTPIDTVNGLNNLNRLETEFKYI